MPLSRSMDSISFPRLGPWEVYKILRKFMRIIAQGHWCAPPTPILLLFNKTETIEVKWHYPGSLGLEFMSSAPWICQSPRLPWAETSSKFQALSGWFSFNNTQPHPQNMGFLELSKETKDKKISTRKNLAVIFQKTQMPTNRGMENKLWYFYTMEYYTAIKKSKCLKHATVWNSVIMLRERSYTLKSTYTYDSIYMKFENWQN